MTYSLGLTTRSSIVCSSTTLYLNTTLFINLPHVLKKSP